MERWTRWEPIKNLSGKYSIDSLTLPKDFHLKIEMSNDSDTQHIEIIFDGAIDAYRYTNESFCFKTFAELSEKYEDAFYEDWSFFKVTNSEYLKWLSEKSETYSEEFPFMHFCIMGDDQIIEVLARYEPEIKIMQPQ